MIQVSPSIRAFFDRLTLRHQASPPDAVAGFGRLYVGSDGELYLVKGDTTVVQLTDSGSVAIAWGGIDGTLADQTDLQSELDAKADLSHTHPSGDITFSGLTAGHVWRASGASAASFAAIAIGDPLSGGAANGLLLQSGSALGCTSAITHSSGKLTWTMPGGARAIELRVTTANGNAPMIMWDDAYTPYTNTVRFCLRQSEANFHLFNFPNGGGTTLLTGWDASGNMWQPVSGSGFAVGTTINSAIIGNFLRTYTDFAATPHGLYTKCNFIASAGDVSFGAHGNTADLTGTYAASGRTLSGILSGMRSYAYLQSASQQGTISDLRAFFGEYGMSGSAAGTLSTATGLRLILNRASGGTITSAYGVRLTDTGSGTVTTNRGFVEELASGAFNFFTNPLGIGNTPTAALDLPASTTSRSSFRIRAGTAPTSPNDGDIWFDGTDLKLRSGGATYTLTKA